MSSAKYEVRSDVAIVTFNNPPINDLGVKLRIKISDAIDRANVESPFKNLQGFIQSAKTLLLVLVHMLRCSAIDVIASDPAALIGTAANHAVGPTFAARAGGRVAISIERPAHEL
jgi:hypothetical protein